MLTGQKLQKLRMQANMTQEQLAEKLFVSRDLISKWETGERRPNYKIILKIAEIFSVKPDEIMEKRKILIDELSDCIPQNFDKENINIENVLNCFLRTLSEQECNIFIRRYYYMDNTSEIAQMFCMRDSNIRLILHRTRKKLKKYLSEVTGYEW